MQVVLPHQHLRCHRTANEEVDAKLQNIMVNICHNAADAAKRYGAEGNYVVGANIAGFEKVVDAMQAQGIV
jgi:glutamate dehydrogenase (NADP+)